MSTQPTRSVGGIGRVLQKTLSSFGVETCGQLHSQRLLLHHVFPPKTADNLLRAGIGWDDGQPELQAEDKSVSYSRTFAPTSDGDLIFKLLEEYTKELCDELREKGYKPGSIGLKGTCGDAH